ncbi:anti-sigma-K factor RskA [Mycolicibacterium madagascariense]|uniref:Anti-sigma-K factor RskA n=2 Tax=Mycolicibacterium madagascariense TaxID=212765 RepID=A0A7I7XM01_9MYCO|nr:anti-sigma factor [Mycolicibacterium madagascariense]MCV7012587.1 anti-sigma factor [Mycolicibacterium madagascariense]BBZ30268.1 anti-sigma-K factor RskA [Mycolicibacterium madagascariense]
MVLATPYALHAMPQSELDDVDRQLATAPAPVALAFADEVRAVREAMALVSASTAQEPPAHLRGRLLAVLENDGDVVTLHPRSTRWRTAILAAAAAVAIGLATFGIGYAVRPAPTSTQAEQIFAARDVKTVSGDIPTGGTATVVFSHARNAGVLVMNDVAPPKPGTVYQMWLVDKNGPKSAGIMDAAAVSPSTTAVLPNLGDSTTLAFTVEPKGGSTAPTSPVFAALPLV